MFRYTYDEEAKAAHIYLTSSVNGKIGSCEVKGDITYRKPLRKTPIDELIILDFDQDKKLVGIELLGSIPEEITKDSSFLTSRIELSPKYGSNFYAVAKEANTIYNSFKSRGMEVDVVFKFNDIKYYSDGEQCRPQNSRNV